MSFWTNPWLIIWGSNLQATPLFWWFAWKKYAHDFRVLQGEMLALRSNAQLYIGVSGGLESVALWESNWRWRGNLLQWTSITWHNFMCNSSSLIKWMSSPLSVIQEPMESGDFSVSCPILLPNLCQIMVCLLPPHYKTSLPSANIKSVLYKLFPSSSLIVLGFNLTLPDQCQV